MKSIFNRFSRFQPTTFKVSYSPEYRTYLQHHAASDWLHPLHILRRRELAERKREALWWHVTSGIDLSRSSVVRSWCRRRLRGAFTEGLKERGFDEFGRLLNVAKLREQKGFKSLSERNADLSLDGSVRLHITPALVTAKYADVRKETGGIIDILVEALRDNLQASHLSNPRPQPRSQPKTLPQSKAPSRPRETASQVLPSNQSQEGQLSQLNLPSHTKAQSPVIRYRSTPSNSHPPKISTKRKTQQPPDNAKPQRHSRDTQ
ncbi:uncharacterized protein CC84DRAFT_1165436 [Paraphaeosphaeria sporulosa]|uniref:Uncharacterized protein n=1 Tax=Paraphaeosphaeria sporulosa TaxID=1460663 RepID=A0A177CEB5_9PLEO|nr:uncharacterized protein CC84DRAFT_1165436 [Paraphaeosphaeria sporulosa]OAG05107.1 hypothetical protein CC84DRAFT_1165436 [Paraphaeosphaeria sporulosa]